MPDNVEHLPPLRDPRNRNQIWRNADITNAVERDLALMYRQTIPAWDPTDPRPRS
jgi:hypothetical protein